jgi:hypothetical protein
MMTSNEAKTLAKAGMKKYDGLKTITKHVPAAVNTIVVRQKPRITHLRGRTIISANEEIMTVNGSVAWETSRVQCNPGLGTYTWISPTARSYEKYKFTSLQYSYVPDIGTTSTPGSVYLAFDYDADDPEPVSLNSLSAYETQIQTHVYDKGTLNVDRKRMADGTAVRRIRSGPVGGDLQLYDPGFLVVATQNCSSGAAIGTLWVHYTIEFHSRITEPVLREPRDMALYNRSSTQTMTTSTPTIVNLNNTVRSPFGSITGGVVTMQKGAYLVNFSGNFRDDTKENFSFYLELLKDNASLVPLQRIQNGFDVNRANQVVSVSQSAYVTFSGTGTLSLSASLTGAAGVLDVVAAQLQIFALS